MIMLGGICVHTWYCQLTSCIGSPLLFPLRGINATKVLFSSSCQNFRAICSISEVKKKDKVIVISGPTGSGKSRLALELAKKLNGEIISADSVQVYQGLDIGSAKPSNSDRKEIAHHLLDVLHPSEEYSAGKFFKDARKATEHIIQRGNVPIVVGGTGLYLRWYIYGKPDVPRACANVTYDAYSEIEQFERNGQWGAAVEFVAEAGDPKVHFLPRNNWYRLRRSLEIIKSSGLPPSAFQVPYDSFRGRQTCLKEEHNDKGLDYDFICFFLSTQRIDLYRSIDLRCEEMLVANPGILTESSWLLDSGLIPNGKSSTKAIGYRHAMEYLQHCREVNGQCSPGDFYAFLSEFQRVSRNFAKRQMIWFRNELIYHWLDASRPLDEVLDFIHDSYHDEKSTDLMVPEVLRMRRDGTSHHEEKKLKRYRPINLLFTRSEDCSEILDWIRKTQSR